MDDNEYKNYNEIEDNTSSLDNVDNSISDDNDYDNNTSNDDNVQVSGVVNGLWKKVPLKYKLIIIGIVLAFVSLIIFLIILITPLIHMGIIEYNGLSSSISYINPSYSYCDSINVDGNLYGLEDYVAGVVQAKIDNLSEIDDEQLSSLSSRVVLSPISYNNKGVILLDNNIDDLISSYEETLKAFSIIVRTSVVYHTNGGKNPIDSSSNFYAFVSNPSEIAKNIANSTAGMVVIYENEMFLPDSDSFFDNATQYSEEKKDYEEILDVVYYDDVEIVDLKKLLVGNVGTEQGLDYIGTYTNLKTGKTYKNYKQYLYRSDDFTFQGKDHLANVGCGTNAAAIILSGEDSSITPASLYIENGYSVGTYFGDHYPYSKSSFSYCNNWSNGYCLETKSSTKIGNTETKEKLISNLSNGGTAILFINYSADKCLVNGESWTGSQHFFTALDYNPVDNTIFISNPGTNSSSQNGWVSLDEFDCVHVAWLMYPE